MPQWANRKHSSMKLAYSTLASPNWDWQKSIAASKAYGYDGIEWRLVDGQVVKPEFPLEQCRQIEAAVSAAGLQTCALDSGASLAHPAGVDRDRHLSEIKSLLHKANALKTHIFRVFPGKYPESVSDEQAMEWVIENLNHLVPEARRLDVSIALELHDLFDWDRKVKPRHDHQLFSGERAVRGKRPRGWRAVGFGQPLPRRRNGKRNLEQFAQRASDLCACQRYAPQE